ncbi:uncharacterized protein LOC129749269 [Uranotaenia lowii]|uniref:uncharacterized protein LOC129749269 n=1 Tax=Uranotaenia lowii TaxID=190385 RepID=UPI00247A2ACD|nr:uncharacterized protein LOC129749269 [Uranotaenia lowii]
MVTKFALSLLPLVVLAYAEECIDYDAHAAEIDSCCSVPMGLPTGPFSNCIKSAEQQVPDKEIHALLSCAFDCYLTEIGIVFEQTVKMNKVKEYMGKLEATAGNLRTSVWQACATIGPKIVEALEGKTFKCHPFALEMKACVTFLIDRKCPDAYFNDKSAICQKVRAGVPPCRH